MPHSDGHNGRWACPPNSSYLSLASVLRVCLAGDGLVSSWAFKGLSGDRGSSCEDSGGWGAEPSSRRTQSKGPDICGAGQRRWPLGTLGDPGQLNVTLPGWAQGAPLSTGVGSRSRPSQLGAAGADADVEEHGE
jgi:hypothetical protein